MSCGFHDRGTTLQADFLSTSTTFELERFKCVLFYRAKFDSHSLVRSLKLLFPYFSSEVDAVSRSCPSDVSSSPLFVRFSIVRLEIRAIELLSRTIYKPLFLLYAASQWPRELRLLKRFLITKVAQVRKDSSQIRIDHSFLASDVSSLGAVEVTSANTGIS